MRTAELTDVEGEFYYHGRVQTVENIDGKNINVTKHLVEDKEDGTMLTVDLTKLRFLDEPIIRRQGR